MTLRTMSRPQAGDDFSDQAEKNGSQMGHGVVWGRQLAVRWVIIVRMIVSS